MAWCRMESGPKRETGRKGRDVENCPRAEIGKAGLKLFDKIGFGVGIFGALTRQKKKMRNADFGLPPDNRKKLAEKQEKAPKTPFFAFFFSYFLGEAEIVFFPVSCRKSKIPVPAGGQGRTFWCHLPFFAISGPFFPHFWA